MNSSTSYSRLPAATQDALSLIRKTVVGFDRITLWVNHPKPKIPRSIRNRLGRKVTIKTRSVTYHAYWQTEIRIHQPYVDGLRGLTRVLCGKYATKITYAEIAIDWIAASRDDAAQLQQYILQHFYLKHSRYAVKFEKSTAYYGPRASETHGKFHRNFVIYADKFSKLARGKKLPCCHLEYRFGSPKLKCIGLFTIGDCAAFDFHGFWPRHLNLVRISSKKNLGRILEPENQDVSGASFRQRADVFLKVHAYQGGFILQDCILQRREIMPILEPIDNRHFLTKPVVR